MLNQHDKNTSTPGAWVTDALVSGMADIHQKISIMIDDPTMITTYWYYCVFVAVLGYVLWRGVTAVVGLLSRGARWVHVALGTRHVPSVSYSSMYEGGVPCGGGGDGDSSGKKKGVSFVLLSWIDRLILQPVFGQALVLAKGCPWGHMYRWVTGKSLVKFRVLHRTGVIVGDPKGLKRVFQTGYKLYDKDLDFSYGPFLPILGSGLVTANGKHWQKQRLLMAPALRIDMLDAILPIAQRAAERLCDKLVGLQGKKVAIDIEEEFRLLTLQVIGEAILSLGPEECDDVFPSLYLPVMEESNRRVLAPWRYLYPVESFKYNSRVKKLDTFIKGIIRERRAERHKAGSLYQQKDVLDKILDSVDKEGIPWNAAAETQLCYEIKTFLLAGHETSAAMLTWTVYELARGDSRDSHDRVRKEAKEHLRGATLERERVEKMEWTLSCLKESLRKYSVVPVVTRDLNTDDELCGTKLPRGSWIICHLQRVHHLYKDPLRWDPERFMPGGEYENFDSDIRPYMFVPFIQGPRNCLGQYFALIEARVVLGLLCAKFSWSLVDPATQGVTHPTVIPIGPVGGMKVYVD